MGQNAGSEVGAGSRIGQGSGFPSSLSSDQIFAILQNNPDALVERKSLMSELARQEGTPIQEDSITDEMLYSKIASSVSFTCRDMWCGQGVFPIAMECI
jgi:hypothetical protein